MEVYYKKQYQRGVRSNNYRHSFSLSEPAHRIIEKTTQLNPTLNMSRVMSQLILDKLIDPKEQIRDELRSYAVKINELQQKLKDMESTELQEAKAEAKKLIV
jgi:hypothetical protein